MFCNPQTEDILNWNNHDLIEAYTSPTQTISYVLIGSYIGMEYHLQYQTHLSHLKGIKEGHHHQDLLHFHHILNLLQGGNNIHYLSQT